MISVAALRRSGYCSASVVNSSAGHCPAGGRWSRVKVSGRRRQEGESSALQLGGSDPFLDDGGQVTAVAGEEAAGGEAAAVVGGDRLLR